MLYEVITPILNIIIAKIEPFIKPPVCRVSGNQKALTTRRRDGKTVSRAAKKAYFRAICRHQASKKRETNHCYGTTNEHVYRNNFV